MYPYRNIFSPQDPVSSPYRNILFDSVPTEDENIYDHRPQAPVAQNTPASFVDIYRELLGRRSGPATAAYAKFLESAPTPEQYKPNKVTRLGAILSGAATGFRNPAAGAEVARNIVEHPYEKALRQYGIDASRLKEAAGLEENDYRSQIGTLKTVSDIKNTEEDNARQAKAGEILNKSRELGMEKTRRELALIGVETHINAETGELMGVNKLTGQVTNFGKISQSSTDRTTEAGKKAEKAGEISLKNAKSKLLFETPIIEGRQTRLQDRAFEHSTALETQRETGREKLLNERNKIKAAVTAKELLPGDVKVIRSNRAKVQSLIDADPGKYSQFWDADTGRLKADKIPEIGTDEYEAYKELYNALYQGTSSLSSGKTVGKYGVVR